MKLIDYIFSNSTLLLAIYGSFVSTGLLVLKVLERREKKKVIKVAMELTLDNDLSGPYISGRKGNQYISLKATNLSSKINTIVDFRLECYNKIIGISTNVEIVDLRKRNSKTWSFPKKSFGFSEVVSVYFILNLDALEFEKSKGSNFDRLQLMNGNKKYCRVVCVDSGGKEYYSKGQKLDSLLKEFLRNEEKVTTESYRDHFYPIPNKSK